MSATPRAEARWGGDADYGGYNTLNGIAKLVRAGIPIGADQDSGAPLFLQRNSTSSAGLGMGHRLRAETQCVLPAVSNHRTADTAAGLKTRQCLRRSPVPTCVARNRLRDYG
jgi:hypothetical protein